MKFATVEIAGEERVGHVDVEKQLLHLLDVSDMVDLITRYDEIKPYMTSKSSNVPLHSVRLLSPLPRPRRNIFCVGKNYHEHAKEFARSGHEAGAIAGAELDGHPAMFTKNASCVIGTGAPVNLHPSVTSEVGRT